MFHEIVSRFGPVGLSSTTALKYATGLLAAVVALVFFAAAILRPEHNFDAVAYAALAKQFRGEEGHTAAYEAMKQTVGSEKYEALVRGAYGWRMANDKAYFDQNLPFYASKPLYVAAVSLLGGAVGSDIMALSIVSAISSALAVLLSFFIGMRLLPPERLWVVPAAWLVSLGLKTATLHTPDAMAIMLQMAFLLAWLVAREGWVRPTMMGVIAIAWIATRSNGIVLLFSLLAAECFYSRWDRNVVTTAAVTVTGAFVTYLSISHLTGNLGQIVLFNFVFVDHPDGMKFPNHSIALGGYLKGVAYGIFEMMTSYPEFFLAFATFTYLFFCNWRRVPSTSMFQCRIQAMPPAMLIAMTAHFLLYPAAWERFFVGFYVLAILLIDRTSFRSFRIRP